MKMPDLIDDKINRLPNGYVFTYTDFNTPVEKTDALIKALNRMVKDGKIRKLAKGQFYKPRVTEFGELKPEIYQVVKDLLEKDCKIIGYITGFSVYNQLGLTTQVPGIIQIGTNYEKKPLMRGIYKVRFIKQLNRITKENIPLLRILDTVRYIKDIPDTSVDKACSQLILIIQKLNAEELTGLKRLVLKYNPATRALTGAMIEKIFGEKEVESVFKSLNPATNYNFSISDKTLPNKQKWYIK